MANVGSPLKVGYQSIATDLIQRIQSGEFTVGAFLPTERELQEGYDTSRTTIRRALVYLAEQNWATSVPNRGVVVRNPQSSLINDISTPRRIGYVDGQTYVCHNLFVRFSSELRARGHHLIHMGLADMSFDEAMTFALDEKLDGLLVWPFDGFPNQEIGKKVTAAMPVVSLDHAMRGIPSDVVTFNYFEAARQATASLLRAGRRNIAVSGMLDMLDTTNERLCGYMRAHKDFDLELNSKNFVFVHTSTQRSPKIEPLIRRLNERDRPDGVFVLQDQFLPNAVQAALQLGLRVPGDIAFTTVGDDHEVIVGDVMNTGIRLDWDHMCREAIRVLEERWANPNGPVETIFVNTSFVDRGLGGTPKAEWVEPSRSPKLYEEIERKYPKPRFFYVIPSGSLSNQERGLISSERSS